MSSPGKSKTKKKSKTRKTHESSSPTEQLPSRRTDDRLLKRFYEPLVLQYVLNCTPGGHIRQHRDRVDESDDDLRRLFIDGLAYICDYQKGGSTVTAIALQDTPEAVVYWIAANDDVSETVVRFLTDILRDLAGMDTAAEDTRVIAEDVTFKRAVEFGRHRVQAYWTLLQPQLGKCLKVLSSSEGVNKDLMTWLTSFQSYSHDILQLCRFSYDTRGSTYMNELYVRSPKISVETEDSNCFSQVRHYIGRLGAHLRASKTIVAAAQRFPMFFDNPVVECCPSPTLTELPPLLDAQTTLDKIVVRMLPKDDKRVPQIQEALECLDAKFKIHNRLVQKYQDPNFKPYVHALELILLEHFYINQYRFVDRDKYIGCSKPACYCCYHYICVHPGDFVRPSCHNKIYLNWRPPDSDVQQENHQRDILNNMLIPIRRDVLRQIEEKRGPRCSHHDSTTGITMTVPVLQQNNSVTSLTPIT